MAFFRPLVESDFVQFSSVVGYRFPAPQHNRYMKNSIARISLTVFIAVFIFTFFMPAMAGSFVPIFGFLALVAILIFVVGNKKYKITGICCLIISIALLIIDYRAGEEHRAKYLNHVNQIESPIMD